MNEFQNNQTCHCRNDRSLRRNVRGRSAPDCFRHAKAHADDKRPRPLLIAGYALAALAFLCLFSLYRLICRIEQGDIFTMANVKGLHAISLEVGAAAALSLLLGITCTILMSAVAVMAAFMVLIIRVIQHSFERAVAMKDELDLTI